MAASGTTNQPLTVVSTLQEAWSLRRVWWFTATARTRARFARTLFGSFWLGLSNLLSIAVLALVYGTVFKVQDFDAYVVYLGLGLVVWNSIAAAMGSAPNLFEHNAQHVHNTNLNPIFYTLEEWAFQVQTFFQSFLLVLLALSFFQASLIPHLLTAGWLPLLNLLLFLYWAPVLVCLLGARYRDVYQLVPIALQLVFLLSPILYEKKNLSGLAWTADFNPLYRVLSPLRHVLIQGYPLIAQDALMLVVNLLGLWFAIRMINCERRHLPFLI
ncbi:MAG: ABC transporter permease [Vulcanococcus sp.]|jgi:lipopolysaccharide transport system permease protein|uniref:ABC transporter permease n=1 Tax=Vulcanococcus sp. TaxID=2856995 RepID=UPI0025FDDA88|nr:ABC transporter permease [Vulcanococcus sp.]MBW0180948.1 ABC transporter permease [Vulcanococcus sp.]